MLHYVLQRYQTSHRNKKLNSSQSFLTTAILEGIFHSTSIGHLCDSPFSVSRTIDLSVKLHLA